MTAKTLNRWRHEGLPVNARMTATSRRNIQWAERAELREVRGRWYVVVSRGDAVGLVYGGDGVMLYPTVETAQRAVRRLNATAPVVVRPE